LKAALRLALALVLLGLLYWLYTVLFPSPEKAVLKRIASLAATATIPAGTNPLLRANKVGTVIAYFSPDAEITYDLVGVGAHTLSGRDEIREAAAGGFAGATSLSVRFQDLTVRLGPDKLSAEVSCTAKVSANGDQDTGIQEMRFQLRKLDGDWLITRAETVKTLQ